MPFKGIAVQHYGVGFKRFQPVFTAADDVRRVARGRDRLAAGRQDIAVAALVEVAHIHDPGEDGHIIHAGYRADDLPVPDDGRIKEQIVRAMPVTDETHVVIAAQHVLEPRLAGLHADGTFQIAAFPIGSEHADIVEVVMARHILQQSRGIRPGQALNR